MTVKFESKVLNWVGDSKQGNGKVFYLRGLDKSEEKIFAVDSLDAEKGMTVSVIAEDKGKYYDVKKLRVDSREITQPKKRGFGGGFRASDHPQKQNSIAMQHSQEMAIRWIGLLLDNEAIKLPATAKRESFLNELREATTAALFLECGVDTVEGFINKSEKAENRSNDEESDEEDFDDAGIRVVSEETEDFNDDFDF